MKTSGVERGYRDLHEHIEALRQAGLLLEIEREINKDTEMHPLVRWQFRGGIPEDQRKAFLFTNVTDSKGRKYDIPVLVCGLAGNKAIYQIGMGCGIDEIGETWIRATSAPLKPNIVASADAPCHEVVFEGEDLLNGNGLDALPVPISTPGWDNAPYTSSSHFITKDPESGVQNSGNYRGQIKAPDRIGMNPSIEHQTGGYIHWLEWKKRGERMPCAVVVGCPPVVSFTAVQKLPAGVDEFHVSGALAGSPLNVVKAKTVDLLVPAEAEVVIEGFVDTEYLEPEAPFGESHGHVNLQEYNAFMNITAITRRKDAVITSWVSQVTPSESSAIKRPAYEASQLEHLRDHLGIKPLFYRLDADYLIWGSEIKVLLASGLIERKLDLDGLGQFMSWEYVPGQQTLFQGIRKLEPGCMLVAELEQSRCRTSAYWDIPEDPPDRAMSDSDWEDAVDSKLDECVKRQLVSDVPLGAFLSGGVDSSLIVAAMGRAKTFSIGFDDPSYNELAYSQKVAEHLSVEHVTQIIEPDVIDLF
ncbi:MAG: UbiD family decarboxylase, partial [Proteobacteria bacterium]|nr:UbiD family decarboxylase [Pseudomonadota bacterium]